MVNLVPVAWANIPQYSNLIDYEASNQLVGGIEYHRIKPRMGALELSTVPAMRPN